MSAVNNINQLRTQTAPANNSIIEVKGYFSPGDGGGGNFFWDTGSYLLSDDGWDIIQINNQNPVTGKWRRLLQDRSSLNIKYFGPRATNAAGLLETVNDTDLTNRAISCLSREWVSPVLIATTANLTSLSGLPTVTTAIDGVYDTVNTPLTDARVLVKNQSTPNENQNGIYVIKTGAWTRIGDFNTGYKMLQTAIPVLWGTINSNKIFGCTNTIAPIVDTDPINFAQLNDWIQDIKVATISNRTLSNLGAIDGIGLASGDRVLVMNQTNPIENGIYTAASGSWAPPWHVSPRDNIFKTHLSNLSKNQNHHLQSHKTLLTNSCICKDHPQIVTWGHVPRRRT